MIIKLKQNDVSRAIKEYIEKLFGDITVKGSTYHRKTKGEGGVIIEVEVEKKEKTHVGTNG